jgi:hypothetical protein
MNQSLAVALASILVFAESSVAADGIGEFDIRTENGEIFIAADDILSYDWANHRLNLAANVRAELAKRFIKERGIVSGIPFAVAVGGKEVYQGVLTTSVSSRSFSSPVIVIDARVVDPTLEEDQLEIQLGYPTARFFEGTDPRADQRIDTALRAAGKLADPATAHVEWVQKALLEMQAIKPGMTREELWKVFQEEGGLSTRTTQRYVYRECPYFKVDVKLDAVGSSEDKLTKSPQDKIRSISTPFLEWSIED